MNVSHYYSHIFIFYFPILLPHSPVIKALDAQLIRTKNQANVKLYWGSLWMWCVNLQLDFFIDLWALLCHFYGHLQELLGHAADKISLCVMACLTLLSVEIYDFHTLTLSFILQSAKNMPQWQHHQTVQAHTLQCVQYLIFVEEMSEDVFSINMHVSNSWMWQNCGYKVLK